MVKKKRGPTLEEILDRPWCYYCERDFDDLKILTLHQKAKHFKCERCGRRLNTAGGLSVHMSQVHKEQLTEIENALPNRAGLDVEIFGMEGVPDDVLQAHQQRVAAQFQQAEAERQAATGNPPAGGAAAGQPAKRPKLEAASDLKKRLAEHRAKRAEVSAGGSSGDVTPSGAQSASTPTTTAQSPITAPQAQPFSYPPPYGGAPATTAPYQQTASPSYQTFSPASAQATPATPAYPTPGYPPQFPPQPGYGAPSSFTHPPSFASSESTPPQPSGLPTSTGLPQRPAFGAPQLNAQQMQQMHMGHPVPPSAPGASNSNGQESSQLSSSVNDLISGAVKEAADKASDSTEKPKKEKAKFRLVYSDGKVSPEEKMAMLPRYAFVRDRTAQDTALEEVPASNVVGTIRDTPVDPSH